jgi:hypothetical protein
MAEGYQVASYDELRHPEWPRWILLRGKLGITAFGVNAWQPNEDGTVIPKHDENDTGHEELYLVTNGHATFTIDGEQIDAPEGTAVFVRDAAIQREATAQAPNTTIVSIGGRSGHAFEPSEWETKYLAEVE